MGKKILVTGAAGQLGKTFKELSKNSSHQWYFTDKQSLDITNREQIVKFLDKNKVDIILNTAAYTNVDNAEKEGEKAFRINAKGVQNLAESALEKSIFLIHFSTDYVFNGRNHQPYKINDKTEPINTYGKSKLAGEQIIQKLLSEYIIIRTSWLFADEGENFITKILQLAQKNKELKVVSDQIGGPTYAHDLAEFVLSLLEIREIEKKSGIYHFSNRGTCSWYDFAKEIVRLNATNCNIISCKATDFATLAERPKYSVLDTSQLQNDFSYCIPKWDDALVRYFNKENHT